MFLLTSWNATPFRLKFGVFNLEEMLLSSTGRFSVKRTSFCQEQEAMPIALIKHQLDHDEQSTSSNGSIWQQTLGADLTETAENGATISLPAFIFAPRVHELNTANSDNLMILEHLHTLLQNYVSNNPSDGETYSPLASIFKICGIKSLIQLNVILTFCSEDWLMNLTARNYRCDIALFLCFDFWKRGLPPQSIVYYRCDNSFVSV